MNCEAGILLLCVVWMLMLLNSCQGQAPFCRSLYDSSVSTFYGYCLKTVTSPNDARGCYWLQHTTNPQVKIPYVGDIQHIPVPDSNDIAAVCLLQLQRNSLNYSNTFSVIFSPDFSARYIPEHFNPTEDSVFSTSPTTDLNQEKSTTIRQWITITNGGRKLDEATVKPSDGDSSPDGLVFIVVGCVATAAVMVLALSIAFFIRNKRRHEERQRHQLINNDAAHRPSNIFVLRRFDRPDSVFGWSHPPSFQNSLDIQPVHARDLHIPRVRPRSVHFDEEPIFMDHDDLLQTASTSHTSSATYMPQHRRASDYSGLYNSVREMVLNPEVAGRYGRESQVLY